MDISVVIVSYNSEGFLWENLNSVVKQTKRFKEIVVVDNRSQDRSLGIIAGFPQVRVIALHENCGYAGGANRGIKECTADLILVANADIILAPDFNASVIEKFAEDPDITLLSPLILRFDRQTVDSAGQALSRSLYPLEIGYNRSLSRVNPGEGPVFSVCGAATVFRRRSLEELELDGEYYDEDFFAFWEDLDIGWRAQLYGFKTYFYPGAIVYHYRSATLKRNFFSRFSLSLSRSTDIKYHLVKNRYLTLIKNFRFRDFWWTVPFAFLKDIIWVSVLTISAPKNIIRLFRSGRYFKNGFRKRKMIKEKLKQREAK